MESFKLGERSGKHKMLDEICQFLKDGVEDEGLIKNMREVMLKRID